MSSVTPIQPEGWARGPGFSWGMAANSGRLVAVAGQLATQNGGVVVAPGLSFAKQFGMALQNIVDVVAAAGGKPSDLMMMRAYVRDMQAYKDSVAEIRGAWMKSIGKHFPAMTMVEVSMLFDPNALVEIDAFAVIPTN